MPEDGLIIEPDSQLPKYLQEVRLGGTNTAFILEVEGVKYYAKEYPNPEQAKCEYVANQLYAELGVPVLKGRLLQTQDRTFYATPLIEYGDHHFKLDVDPQTNKPPNPTHQRLLESFFIPSAWLLDWDAVGTGNKPLGNVLILDSEHLVLIDHGGALLWRGLKGKKAEKNLTAAVPEIDIFKKEWGVNQIAAAVLKNTTHEQMVEQAQTLGKLSKEKIRQIVTSAGFDNETSQKVISLLLERQKWILEHFGLSNPTAEEVEKVTTLGLEIDPQEVSAALQALTETMDFKPEVLAKVRDLEQELPGIVLFDPDLQQAYAMKWRNCKTKLNQAIYGIDQVYKALDRFKSETSSQSPEALTKTKSRSEFALKFDQIKEAVEAQLAKDAQKYDQQQSRLRKIRLAASGQNVESSGRQPNRLEKMRNAIVGRVESATGRQVYDRRDMYNQETFLSSSFWNMLDIITLTAYQDHDYVSMTLEQLKTLRDTIETDLVLLPSYEQKALEETRLVCRKYRLSQDAEEKCLEEVKKFTERNRGITYILSDVKREISKRQWALEAEVSDNEKQIKEAVTEIINFIKPFIEPKIGNKMPESIWWTKEILALFLYTYQRLTDLRNQLGNQLSQKLENMIAVALREITEKLTDEIHYTAVARKEKLDLTHSPDVMYHSSSDLDAVVAMLTGGKLKSLGTLRQEHGAHFARATDNKGGGKRHDQEIHQIYFNTLGEDVTYPQGYTRNPYSPIRISTAMVKDDPEVMALLKKEADKVRQERAQRAALLRKYNIKDSSDRSRFLEHPFYTDEKLGDADGPYGQVDNNYGLGGIPYSFYISTGFFFMKKDLLRERQFTQDDGVAVFDDKYTSVKDRNYLQVDWQQEGCFVTDELGWAVIRTVTTKELEEKGLTPEEVTTEIDKIKANLVIVNSDDWGGQYSNTLSLFVGPHPNITLDDGTVISGDEVLFLESFAYLDEEDKKRKEYILGQQQGVQRYNQALRQALQNASTMVASHLQTKHPRENQPSRIVPTLRVGELPNAAGSTPHGSLYKVV